MSDYSNVTRVEVIDHRKSRQDGTAREFICRDEKMQVDVQAQDDGRTLKVFLADRGEND